VEKILLRMTGFKILTTIALLITACAASATERRPGIEIGIAPFLPVKILVQNYASLSKYLQTRLNEPVTIVSAPDYKTHYKFIQKREFPLIITTANSAYLAWSEYGYIPLLQPQISTHPVLIVSKGLELIKLSALKGKAIAMSDATALVSMQGMQLLRQAGLDTERDLSIKNMPNHSAAVNHVISGEVDAAIVSDRALMQMSQTVRNQISIAYAWEKYAAPGIVYLGSPDVPRERLELISHAIIEFAQNTAEGEKLFREMGYGGLKPITAEELQMLAPYGALLKEIISVAQ
jgi:phosphonate transport system substrate-binding protein